MQKSNNSKFFLSLSLAALLAPGLLLTAQNAQAQDGFSHYISDNVAVPMRRGAGVEFRIERMLPAGSPVKILETEGNWSRVEFMTGNRTWEGWVNQVGIQSERPARLLLAEEAERYNRLDERFKQLQKEHNSLREQTNTANRELETLKQENFKLNNDLQHITNISGGAVELDNQNREMRRQISDLETQNILMREQIAQAEDTVKRQWFLTGAGVLVLGLLLGRFFRMPSRRGGWDKI